MRRPRPVFSLLCPTVPDMKKKDCYGNWTLLEPIAIMNYNIVKYSRDFTAAWNTLLTSDYSVQALFVMNSGRKWSLGHRIALDTEERAFFRELWCHSDITLDFWNRVIAFHGTWSNINLKHVHNFQLLASVSLLFLTFKVSPFLWLEGLYCWLFQSLQS